MNAHPVIDPALIAFLVFVGFFVSLILYLRREDRREGYPLEEDPSGRLRVDGSFLFTAAPKTFILPHGLGTISVPNRSRDQRPVAARRSVVPGSPLIPTGNPMLDGVGPAAYADRAKTPELSGHGTPKIVPMRIATDFSVVRNDADPRGMPVLGTDGAVAGTVTDLWVDRPEAMVRYLEVALTGDGSTVLLPITMALIDGGRRRVRVDAITAAQFAEVPRLSHTDQVTVDEEERVSAYYGGGFLYATKSRLEAFL